MKEDHSWHLIRKDWSVLFYALKPLKIEPDEGSGNFVSINEFLNIKSYYF